MSRLHAIWVADLNYPSPHSLSRPPALLIYRPPLMKCLHGDTAKAFAGGRATRTHPEPNDRSGSQRLSSQARTEQRV